MLDVIQDRRSISVGSKFWGRSIVGSRSWVAEDLVWQLSGRPHIGMCRGGNFEKSRRDKRRWPNWAHDPQGWTVRPTGGCMPYLAQFSFLLFYWMWSFVYFLWKQQFKCGKGTIRNKEERLLSLQKSFFIFLYKAMWALRANIIFRLKKIQSLRRILP